MKYASLILLLVTICIRTNAQTYHLNGNTVAVGNDCYRITQNVLWQNGTIWYTQSLDLNKPFDIDFLMNFGWNDAGADGMAFVLQTVGYSAIGASGGGMGYTNFSPSLDIEFDTYFNAVNNDPAQDHIAIVKNGDGVHNSSNTISAPVILSNVENNQNHKVRVSWNPVNNNIRVYFDCVLRIYTYYNIRNIFPGNIVWWGFTGATGGESNEQTVCLDNSMVMALVNDTSICAGQSVQLNIVSGTNYVWTPNISINNPNIPNPVVNPGSTITYYVSYNDNCSYPRQDSIKVNVNPIPAATASTTQNVVCSNSTIQLFGSGSGGSGSNYIFSWSGPNGFSSNLQNPIILNAQQSNTGIYHLTVSDINGCSSVNNAQVNIAVNIVKASVISGNQAVCKGDIPVAFNVVSSALGSGTLTYQWQSANNSGGPWSNIVGAIFENYSPPALFLSTWYRIEVISTINSSQCYSISNLVFVECISLNADLIQDATLCVGGTLTAPGGYSAYLWSNGATTQAIIPNNSGLYSITVDDPTGCHIQDNSNVILNTISVSIPTGQTICTYDDPIPIPVTVAAAGTLSYQWQSGTNQTGPYTNIGGANTAAFIPSLVPPENWYRVLVTSTINGVVCSAISNAHHYLVNEVTSGGISSDQTISYNSVPAPFTWTSMTVVSGPMTLQWQNSTDNGVTWFNITGATSLAYAPPALIADTWYRRIVTSTLNGISCTDTSNVLHISINNVSAGLVAANQTICKNSDPPAFTEITAASGTGTLSYQWQSAMAAVGPWSNITAATAATYDPPALTINYWYRRVVTSTLNGIPISAMSNVLAITINNVTASLISADQTICSGTMPSPFTVTTAASGIGVLTYQWQSATVLAGPFGNIIGAQNATFAPSTLTVNTWYRVIITSTLNSVACSAISNVVAITINNVTASVISADQTICSGTMPAPFTVTTAASGSGILSYQWQSATVLAGPFGNINGAQNSTFAPSTLTVNTWYRVIITSTLNSVACSAISNVVAITINNVTASVISADQTICSGTMPSPFTVTTAASGIGVLTYQWQSATVLAGPYGNINGAQNSTFAPPALTVNTWYRVIVSSTLNSVACSAISNVVVITINNVTASVISAGQTICSGTAPAPFTVATAASGSGVMSYQWQSATVSAGPYANINGAQNSTFAPSTLTVNTFYRVIVSSTLNSVACSAISNVVAITVNALPIANAGPNDTICPGNPFQAIFATADHYDSLLWTTSGTGTFTDNHLLNATYNPGIQDITNGSVILSLTAYGQTSCGDSVHSLLLTIPEKTTAFAGEDDSICAGFTYHLAAATSANANSLIWSTSGTGSFDDPTAQNPVYTPSAWDITAGSITLSLHSVNTAILCGDSTDSMILKIKPLPDANAGPDLGICVGDSAMLSGSGGFTCLWSNGSTMPITFVAPSVTSSFYLSVTDLQGCNNSDTVEVVVHPIPTIWVTPANPAICKDSAIQLTANGAATYIWGPLTGLSGTFGPNVNASPKQTITYTLSGISTFGCIGKEEVTVKVVATPLTILPDTAYLCMGTELLLNAGYNNDCDFQWQDGSYSQFYQVEQPGIYFVTVRNEACVVSDTTVVDNCTIVWAPNAFTPNGNNINDAFFAKASTSLVSFEMLIFNKWGELIFETNDILVGWDGTYKGKDCPQGVYVYLIKWLGQGDITRDKKGRKVGSVSLIR